jgi:hypothetical protein
MADPIQVVLIWLNSIKIDPEYLKPGNFLLIILILVTGGVGLISLLVYILEQRKIPILYFDRVWKQGSSQSTPVLVHQVVRQAVALVPVHQAALVQAALVPVFLAVVGLVQVALVPAGSSVPGPSIGDS